MSLGVARVKKREGIQVIRTCSSSSLSMPSPDVLPFIGGGAGFENRGESQGAGRSRKKFKKVFDRSGAPPL